MELVFSGIFWLSIFFIIHTYIIYPISLWIFNFFAPKSKPGIPNILPSVSIIIAAYNEEKVIAERIENIKNLDYDFEKLELIIGSDCSSDDTEAILSRMNKNFNWLKVKFFELRRGKAAIS